ncbi:MAG: hypothetical protein HY720_25105 [Planctomycetes bacterium]|nr:hypothetical protein [Planctomycetota bacterium]
MSTSRWFARRAAPAAILLASFSLVPAIADEGLFPNEESVDPSEVSLSPAAALALARQAGLDEAVVDHELVRPLAPGAGLSYIFRDGNGAVVVDVATRQAVRIAEGREPASAEARGIPAGVSVRFVREATRRIRLIARSAIVVWAGGRRNDGKPLLRPYDTKVWDFVAVAFQGTGVLTWTICYDGVWTIRPREHPPMGVVFLDLTTVRMDVVEAWRRVVAAGYKPPFGWWALQKSLHPACKNPFYVFPYGNGYVFVDTVTGEVSSE